jgi:argininosuccinate synthase
MQKTSYKKIALAYSGGLDTSIIIPWLKENYGDSEIVAISVNVGQKEDWDAVEKKAIASGASKIKIADAREEFARDYLFPMIRAGAFYEDKYLLGTSIARPLQAKLQAEFAQAEGCDAVAHGCTGKGNDQVRFELTYKALVPNMGVIAPWRIWDIHSREDAIEYAQKQGIDIGDISKKNIYSRDWNIWHMSHEGGHLEDPWNRPQEDLFKLSKSPKDAPDVETEITIDFEKGVPVGLDGQKESPLAILSKLNEIGGENGIGRADIVEDRIVGMKSRGVYETPAGTILMTALKELEMLTIDAETLAMKRSLAQKYADLVYQGKWFTTLRTGLEAFMTSTARFLTGSIRVVLYKGNVIIAGRKSPYSLYLEDLASFGESSYDHHDATGFINLYGLSTGVQAMVQKEIDPEAGQGPDILGTAASYHDR